LTCPIRQPVKQDFDGTEDTFFELNECSSTVIFSILTLTKANIMSTLKRTGRFAPTFARDFLYSCGKRLSEGTGFLAQFARSGRALTM